MNLFTRTLSKIFKSGNQQELDRVKPLINNINALEDEISKLKEEDFKERTHNLRKSVMEGKIRPSSSREFCIGKRGC